MNNLEIFTKNNNYKVIGIYPNSDPGSYNIIDVINKYHNHQNIKFFKNIPQSEFVNTLRNAAAIIGNSSMGFLEAPYYKIPVINVGNRQRDRLNAGNVEFTSFETNKILKCLNRACFNSKYRNYVSKLPNPYRNGNASKKIVKFLNNIDLSDKKWLIKKNIC